MVFRPARTYDDPSQGANLNRGFPAPGAGEQTVGYFTPPPPMEAWSAVRPTKGRRTFWDTVFGSGPNRGYPAPTGAGQGRPLSDGVVGALPGDPDGFGGFVVHEYPYFSRGTGAFAPQFGQVSYNPIGAGVPALNRVQASYGPAASYENGEIYWTSQAIPTSVNLQGLTNPDVLAAVLGPIQVQAAVRVE